MSNAPVPTICRAVHYVSHGSPIREDGTQAFPSVRRSAEITEVDEEGRVGLLVKDPIGIHFHPLRGENGPIPYAEPVPGEPLQGGTWHWPEHV
ncbi:hypothetical protein AMK17_19625 [Streptomyces sp. CB00072]|uniref:hypothetical protein n=1 Tax=Streptomyces sp. CB00072 TaxID=1703928 RepID=UPI00093D28F4|nr:hypothetical protein [Streptomyces sp. CB00072]OKI55284.1 hypothetical protein AMK17_19625 [Streptomyces sp. CB00072]